MIKIDKFKMEDLEGFEPRWEFPDIVQNMEYNLATFTRECLSILYRGKLICIAGVNYHRPGVGEVWLIPSEEVDKHKFEFYKGVLWLVENYLMKFKAMHRLEMAIAEDWEKGHRWAKSIGFVKEGVMKKWCRHKKDHTLYARVA